MQGGEQREAKVKGRPYYEMDVLYHGMRLVLSSRVGQYGLPLADLEDALAGTTLLLQIF